MVNKFMKKFYMTLVYIFLYAPIIILIVFSFNNSKLRGSWSGFTLKWYVDLFNDRNIINSFYNTIFVAIIATIVSTVLGTISAIGIHFLRGYKKKAILNVNYIPVLNPDIVTAVALMSLFGFLSISLGRFTMAVSHIIFCTPYVILSVLPKLRQMDQNIVEAAMDLGAKPFYAIYNVVIPQIKTGISTGALMAFTLSLDDFIISFFTTGKGVSNLSITIYSMAKKGINPSINALSTILFGTILILLLIINKRNNEEEREIKINED